MGNYTPEQRRNIRLARQATRNDRPKIQRALLEAMAVEANFRHVQHGDRDSQGVLQQRPSMGWGPYIPGAKGVKTDINDFLVRARRVAGGGYKGTAGQLAQAVQRSAFPDRYDQRRSEVNALMGGPVPAGDNVTGIAAMPKIGGGGGGDRKAAIASWLMSRASGKETSLMDLASTLKSQVSLEAPNNPRPRGDSNVAFSPANGVPDAVEAGLLAQKLGLRVSENPYFDKVDPVHTSKSDHYRTVGTYKGKKYGGAIDVSGNPGAMRKFFATLEKRRKGLKIDDLFYDPMGYSYDEGRRWGKTIGGHGDHVHASFR